MNYDFNRYIQLSLLLSFLFMGNIIAQDQFDKVEIKTEKVTENIYMLKGQGGNIAILLGDEGVFMIDDQFAPLSEKILTAIQTFSDQPLKYLINTHWHGDHTGGNENMQKEGAVIVAHKNVRERLSTEQIMKAFSRTVPAAPEGAWPVITFEEDIQFYINGEAVMIFHVHNAHTDGDAIVYFSNSNVLHTGDTFFRGRYPFIDLGSGGSINGMIESANQVLMLINEETKIIPGHGDLSAKAELSAYRDMMVELRNRVNRALETNMSLEEIKASNLSKDYDEEWGGGFISPEKFIDTLYTDLSREKK